MKKQRIPSRSQCLALMEEAGMPPHIQQHSLVVADIAVTLSDLLNAAGVPLNTELAQAGALLHDIAKMRSIETGENHSEAGADMLEEMGYFEIAPIVREHVFIDLDAVSGPLTESLIVNYADKRVKHDRIVSIEDRFTDLLERYTMSEEQRARMMKRLKLYQRLERKIFERLAIRPSGPEILGLSPVY